jgi:hypothetical protein
MFVSEWLAVNVQLGTQRVHHSCVNHLSVGIVCRSPSLDDLISPTNLAPQAVHFQFSIFHFQQPKRFSHANLVPQAVHFQLSIFHFQLSKRFSHANLAPQAVHFQFSIFHFQQPKRFSHANLAPQAVPLSTLEQWNFPLSILNSRNAFRMRTSRHRPFHFQFSIFNFQLPKRFSHANLAPQAVHFQSSIFNCRNAFRTRTSRHRLFHFQSSIFNSRNAFRMRTSRHRPFHFQFSIFHFQLPKRFSHANRAP